MILRTAERYAQVFANLFIVLRDDDDEVAKLVHRLHPTIVVAADADEGMSRSLAAGIAAARDHPYIFVALADMPFVAPTTLQCLYDMLMPAGIVRPIYRGTPGHPVVFAREHYDALTRLKGDAGARTVIRDNPNALVQLWVNDDGVVRDIDRPD